MTRAWRQLALLSLAELLALSLWFSASAVLPALRREWALGDGGAAGLTIAVQAGFIAGTLGSALTNLPDVFSARAVMKVGILLGAATNAALDSKMVSFMVLKFGGTIKGRRIFHFLYKIIKSGRPASILFTP